MSLTLLLSIAVHTTRLRVVVPQKGLVDSW